MNEDDFTPENLPLGQSSVAIIGMGLMGGSLALALRGKVKQILGIESNPQTLAYAAAHHMADELSAVPHELLPQANLILLATPVKVIMRLLEQLPQLHPGAPVVIDIGSTKVHILQAMERLPRRFDPIGGHPMCGKEQNSITAADPAIFHHKTFAFTPLERSSARARHLAEELAHALEMRPLFLDAPAHDHLAAHASHAPYLLACALAASTPQQANCLISTGFASTSRLAGSSPAVMLDILTTNRQNTLNAVDAIQQYLTNLADALQNKDDAALLRLLTHAAERRSSLLEQTTLFRDGTS